VGGVGSHSCDRPQGRVIPREFGLSNLWVGGGGGGEHNGRERKVVPVAKERMPLQKPGVKKGGSQMLGNRTSKTTFPFFYPTSRRKSRDKAHGNSWEKEASTWRKNIGTSVEAQKKPLSFTNLETNENGGTLQSRRGISSHKNKEWGPRAGWRRSAVTGTLQLVLAELGKEASTIWEELIGKSRQRDKVACKKSSEGSDERWGPNGLMLNEENEA